MGVARERIPLVGRDPELSELEAEFHRAVRGEFCCLLIEGEAGIGKSRLASEFQSRHLSRAVALAARGYVFGGSTAFGLWVEALDGHLRRLPNKEIRRLCGGALDDLATLLPSAAAARGRSDTSRSSRIDRLEGLARLLDNLTRDRPAIVHLDDIHLADASSCETLDFVAHNLPRAPILLIACARSHELAARRTAIGAISRLEREGTLRRIELEPLSPEATGELTGRFLKGRRPSSRLVEWLFARSRGNPLFATALLDALIDQGANPAEPALAAVPDPLRYSVMERLAALPPGSKRILEWLVVLSRRVSIGDLVMFTATTLEEQVEALEALVDSRLVVESEVGGAVTYELAHPLVEETIYENLAAARRILLHRVIGRTLSAAGRWAEAAPHIAGSAKAGDREGIEGLLEALRRAWSESAFHEAFGIAVALADVLPSGDSRWLDVVEALSLEGEWFFYQRADIDSSEGIRIMREIERVLDASKDRARLASINFHLAGFLGWGMGDLAEAERRGHTAIALFREIGDEHGALMAANENAWIVGLAGDFSRQEEAARRVLKAADGAGDHGATLMALGCLAFPLVVRGRFQEGELLLRRSIDLARAQNNRLRYQFGHTVLAMSLASEGRLREASETLAEAMQPQPDAIALDIAVVLLWLSGDLRAAAAEAKKVLKFPGSRNVTSRAIAALCEAERGAVAEARAYIADTQETARGRRSWFTNDWCRWGAGLIAWAEGNLELASADMKAVVERFQSMGVKPYAVPALLDLTEIYALAGRTDDAFNAAADLGAIAEAIGNDHYRALAALGGAWAEVVAGRNEGAAARAREARAVFNESGHLLLEGRTSQVLGHALVSSDRPAAVVAFDAARRALETCGAERRVQSVLRELRDLGKPGRRAARAVQGSDSLTPREREVATLAIEGLTARQIAERLFIGERTVETHLANVYAKVGVTSKVALARRAAEIDLESDKGRGSLGPKQPPTDS